MFGILVLLTAVFFFFKSTANHEQGSQEEARIRAELERERLAKERAAATTPALAASTTVTFVYDQWPPLEFMDGDGNHTGVSTIITKEVCRRIGVTPRFSMMPFKRCLLDVEDGKADALYSIYRTPEREGKYFYPEVGLYSEGQVLFARKASRFKVEKLEDLRGKSVLNVRGSVQDPEFNSYTGHTLLETSNAESQFKMLDLSRVDFAINFRTVAYYYINKLKLDGQFEIMDYRPTKPQYLYVVFSKKLGKRGAQLADEFSKVLSDLYKEGFIDATLSVYTGGK